MTPRRPFGLILLGLTLLAVACGRQSPAFDEPPNVLLVMVDTLRADHLTFHGYEFETSPAITARMAAGGIVFENAYAPAPWTAPSVAAMMTGKDPSWLIREADLADLGIPDDERTLAERFAEAGYETRAFVGNALIHGEKGFAQGFDQYWVVPDGLKSIPYPAERVLDPALAWVEGRGPSERPYFLYVHFMDPHGPYTSPDLIDGRSEFYPDYRGSLRGTDQYPLTVGNKAPGEDPAADVRQMRALYDSEIKYVDRAVGALIDAAESSSRRRTLVAFVADHGEELHDHGGWSHGQTVYEEQIRVPLAFRAKGLVPGGTRVPGNVETIGLGRTLLAAAGIPSQGMEGEDLLPVILGERAAPARRPIFVRHWHRGPIRAALLVDRRRTLLFNHRQPFAPTSAAERHFQARDTARLARFAAFDLDRDPAQLNPRPPAPDDIETAYAMLDPTLDGVRVILRGVGGSGSVAGSLRFSSPPTGAMPLFLADRDEVTLDGSTVRFRLVGESPPKGFLVLGAIGELEDVQLDSAGEQVAVEVGTGASWTGSPLSEASLRRSGWPTWSGRPSLRIWSGESRAVGPARALDDETRAMLRALGYL